MATYASASRKVNTKSNRISTVYEQTTLASGIGRIPFVSVDTITTIRTNRVAADG